MKSYFNKMSLFINNTILNTVFLCSIKGIEDVAADGATCDPKHHEILYEDTIIRVINVVLKPQEDEVFHKHERCAIMFVDMPANIEYYENPNDPTQIAWTSTDNEPRSNFIPFEKMHKVKNIDNKEFRAFRIEFKLDLVSSHKSKEILDALLDYIKREKENLEAIRRQLLIEELKKSLATAPAFSKIAKPKNHEIVDFITKPFAEEPKKRQSPLKKEVAPRESLPRRCKKTCI